MKESLMREERREADFRESISGKGWGCGGGGWGGIGVNGVAGMWGKGLVGGGWVLFWGLILGFFLGYIRVVLSIF